VVVVENIFARLSHAKHEHHPEDRFAKHGGTLTCRPNSERGTTFRLELPARAAHVTLKKTKAAAL
jgi:hypothetical protein